LRFLDDDDDDDDDGRAGRDGMRVVDEEKEIEDGGILSTFKILPAVNTFPFLTLRIKSE